MKYISFLLALFPFFMISCSDSNYEPKSKDDLLIGYWAITHIQTIEHIGDGHNTIDKDVPAHGIDSYMDENNYRWDVLIFDDDFVTVRGDMPNRPRASDYDMETIDGQIAYMEAFDKWFMSIGDITDQTTSPVGKYSIKGNDLIIGSLNMGRINFVSDNEFTLEYKHSISSSDYIRYTYTYSRIYSLTL